MSSLKGMELYNVPRECRKCGGVMVFKGVGEYQCEKCNAIDYDDYGKVRRYIEENRGATAAQIEAAVGVPQRTVRRLLKDGRLEITEGSKVFIRCEICGKQIRSGQFCPECEVKVHRSLEQQQRERLHKNEQFIGMVEEASEGQKRFVRDQK